MGFRHGSPWTAWPDHWAPHAGNGASRQASAEAGVGGSWRRKPVPVSVPLAQVFLLRSRVDVGQRDDVAAVCTQPLLVEATLPVLQLIVLIFVGDADVGVVGVHAHARHSGMVTLQKVQVDLFITLQTLISHSYSRDIDRTAKKNADAQNLLLSNCVSTPPHRCGVWTPEGESDVNCPQRCGTRRKGHHWQKSPAGRSWDTKNPFCKSVAILCPHTHSLLWN